MSPRPTPEHVPSSLLSPALLPFLRQAVKSVPR